MKLKALCLGCAVLFSGYRLAAHASISEGQAGSTPHFEVASVKPSENLAPGMIVPTLAALPGGRLTVKQAVLRVILQNAYQVRAFQIVGAPDWINSAKYDIEAKAEDPKVTPLQLALMLQPLLEERFKLVAHREIRELPVYELTPARRGLKLPPPEKGTCVVPFPNVPPGPPAPGQQPVCGRITGSAGAAASIDGRQVTMSDFIRTLSAMIGRTIIDKTGYADPFDVHLTFARDEALASLAAPDVPAAPDPSTASIFTVLQEQLGVRLSGTKGSVEVIVIDHIERPTGN